ncbi:CBS domain-containing protein [Candidatus Micrarchaeota archaeon]|nr:CBS domain-containing protein [Candidatus Micrarchaeota archaeon]
MGSDLKVGDIMKKNVITINEDKPLTDVAKLMKKHDVGSIVVIREKKAEGIITERDIIHKIISAGKDYTKVKASDVMSAPIMVIKPETTLEESAKSMRKHAVKRLPVVNERMELVGIITERDILEIFPAVIDLIEEKAQLR